MVPPRPRSERVLKNRSHLVMWRSRAAAMGAASSGRQKKTAIFAGAPSATDNHPAHSTDRVLFRDGNHVEPDIVEKVTILHRRTVRLVGGP